MSPGARLLFSSTAGAWRTGSRRGQVDSFCALKEFREAELFLVLPAQLHGFLSSRLMTHSCSRNGLRRGHGSPGAVPEQQNGR